MASSLSVVIPTRDTRDVTLRCLAAVIRELPAGGAVVVVDDASRDDTVEAVGARFPAVRVVALPAARGFSGAVNAGLAVATGDVCLVLNSDAEVQPGCLAALVAAFDARPRLGAAGARLFAADGKPEWSGGRAPDAGWLLGAASGAAALAGRLPAYRRWKPVAGHAGGAVDWLPGTALALRTDALRAFDAEHVLDETLGLYAQDLDLCLRLRDAGWELAVVADARVVHAGGVTVARHAETTSARQDPAALWQGLVRVAAKRGGPAAAHATARVLRIGAWLRIAARALATPFVARGRRAVWRSDTRMYRRARAAL